MKIKVFQTNPNGKIEFTPAELEKLLNDTYEEGQRNCDCAKSITWTNPYINTTPYYSTTCATNSNKDSTTIAAINDIKPHITIDSTDAAEISKHIDKIIKKATAQNDVFSKLAKELNF
jgi:hypothetical protein